MCVSQLAKHWERASSDEAAVASVGVVWRDSSLESRVSKPECSRCLQVVQNGDARHWTGTALRLEGKTSVQPCW